MVQFSQLGLDERILQATKSEGYVEPTPIQAAIIPALLDGRDVMGVAQTGTGKTAAYVLPLLHLLSSHPPSSRRPIRALILTPTRELASQIGERVRAYGQNVQLYSTVMYGGVSQVNQVRALNKGVDILCATPGRLLDLFEQGHIDLSQVAYFVLDEADRMLDMGFSKDIERILSIMPPKRQNLMLSATMPKSIQKLATAMLIEPLHVEINPEMMTGENIEQYVAFVQKQDKQQLLIELLEGQMVSCGIVFTRTKHGANKLAKHLNKHGIPTDSIHGDKSQAARSKALQAFRDGDVFILVATDVASRGIDVDDITHVFNYDLPNEPEVYVHRIGRTGRAGKDGLAYSFCDETESGYLVGIQNMLGEDIEVLEEQPYHFPKAVPQPGQKPGRVQFGQKPPHAQKVNRGKFGGASQRGQKNQPRKNQKRNSQPNRNANTSRNERTNRQNNRPNNRRKQSGGLPPKPSNSSSRRGGQHHRRNKKPRN
jgi:ATP-dependent RNA helicase RhlE